MGKAVKDAKLILDGFFWLCYLSSVKAELGYGFH